MSKTMRDRLRRLEQARIAPECASFLQMPGETIADLEARVKAWKATPGPKVEPLMITRGRGPVLRSDDPLGDDLY